MVIDVKDRQSGQAFESGSLEFGTFDGDDEVERIRKIGGQVVGNHDALSTG